MHNAQFHKALEDGDVEAACAIWAEVAPHLPQPANREEALASLHGARTYLQSIPFWKRAYSHAWLTDRGLPSGLPDKLRPRAERLYPRIQDAVGIAVRVPMHRKELGKALQAHMMNAVEECYADGVTDPELVKARVLEIRRKILRGD